MAKKNLNIYMEKCQQIRYNSLAFIIRSILKVSNEGIKKHYTTTINATNGGRHAEY